VVLVPGAGSAAGFPDVRDVAAGARLDRRPWTADIVVRVRPPGPFDGDRLHRGSILVGLLDPGANPNRATVLDDRGVVAFALEAVPRISRAQAMDALTSQATVAGYRAALLSAQHLTRFDPMPITAA
jgi:NAD(P) transhydrogenase subunit alpha